MKKTNRSAPVLSALPSGAMAALLLLPCFVPSTMAGTWHEAGDAGELISTGQAILGTVALTEITGEISHLDDVDVYRIRINSPSAFSADVDWPAGATEFLDSELFLFDSQGFGIAFNDDTAGPDFRAELPAGSTHGPTAVGIYYLAIASYERMAQSADGAIFSSSQDDPTGPDGPGGAKPLTGWAGAGLTVGPYTIRLTGAFFLKHTIMPLGDSLTVGDCSACVNTRPGYRDDLDGFYRQASCGLDFEYVGGQTDVGGDHQGLGGRTALQILSQSQGVWRSLRPDVVLVMAGTNDFASYSGGAPPTGNLDQLVNAIRADLPVVELYVAAIPYPGVDRTNASDQLTVDVAVDSYNAHIRDALAANDDRIHFVDVNGALTAPGYAPGDGFDDQAGLPYPTSGNDHLHPTDAGFSAIGQAWFDASASMCAADSEADGLSNEFENGFAGAGVTITNPGSTPPNTASATGSAESGATITTGNLAVSLPPGTEAQSSTTPIVIELVPASPGAGGPKMAISGALLPVGTTKAVDMPFGGKNAVCIDDRPQAEIDTVDAGACAAGKVEVAIPALGAPPVQKSATTPGGVATTYRVSRTGPVTIRIEGLVHSAIGTVSDQDLDTVQDVDDDCPAEPGPPGNDGCPPEIDIKPGSDSNPVRPSRPGLIPVAILGSATFDVREVDVTTLAFGPAGASPAHGVGGHWEDVNEDGVTDIVSHYAVNETGIAVGDTTACLFGETVDGGHFVSCDVVRPLF